MSSEVSRSWAQRSPHESVTRIAVFAGRIFLKRLERVPEPELMLDPEQARAYADADFSEPHARFIELLSERLPVLPEQGRALDLGCGPGDIAFRFLRRFPGWSVDGIDASPAMLELGLERRKEEALGHRIEFHEALLPVDRLPHDSFDLCFSNSLLHHLPHGSILWQAIRQAGPSRGVFVMDLVRPDSREEAQALVEQYAGQEPEVLKVDFFNSLLAAYRLEEIKEQLTDAGLSSMTAEKVSDRHVIVWKAGTRPEA